MILAGDLDSASREVDDRLIAAAMSELELVGLRPQGQTEQLMAEADAKYWHFTDQAFERFDGIRDSFRIAGAVADEHTVGFVFENGFGRGAGGEHDHIAADFDEITKDVVLHAA